MIAPKEEEIARVMEVLQPTRERERCMVEVISSIQLVAWPSPKFVPRGAVRRQLRQLATTLNKAETAIKKIPKAWQRQIFRDIEPDDFVFQLRRVGQTSEQLAGKISVKRSGGAARGREEAAKGRIAAKCAFDLLNDWGGRVPTLTKSGPYFRLAGLLFEIATGHPDKEMNRACTSYLEELREDGHPNAKELRHLQKVGKRQPPPNWILPTIKSKRPAK